MTIPEEVPKCLFGWCIRVGGVALFFSEFGKSFGEKFESCGGKLWSLRTFSERKHWKHKFQRHPFFTPLFEAGRFFGPNIWLFFFWIIVLEKEHTQTQLSSDLSRKWLWSGTPPRMRLGTRLVVWMPPPKTAADWLEKIGPAKRKMHHFKNPFSGETSVSHYLPTGFSIIQTVGNLAEFLVAINSIMNMLLPINDQNNW